MSIGGKMKNIFDKDYYLGLDIGTESVGWAVSDTDYNIIKAKGKMMWGVRLFDEASTSAERRVFRSARRRLERKKNRINLLQMIFSEAIAEIDPGFFQRMKDSFFTKEDKQYEMQSNTLFNDLNFNDAKYNKLYPTIYHLRSELIKGKKTHDVRLVYLAIHHILKHRGHFLFEGQNMNSVTSFKNVFTSLSEILEKEFTDISLECESLELIENNLRDQSLTRTEKKRRLKKILGVSKDDKARDAIIGLICGTKEKLSQLFTDDDLKTNDMNGISFNDNSYDSNQDKYEEILGDRIIALESIKALHDWSILADILHGGNLNGKQYLSISKVNDYENHKADLKLLKRVVKKYIPEEYKSIFSDVKETNNYAAYCGVNKKNKNKQIIKRCKQDDFYTFISTKLKKISNPDEDIQSLMTKKENGTLLPLQKNGDNGIIPYQIHKMELMDILSNASVYLPFLKQKDEYEL
ncbi:MAG: hypothetical protein XD91_1804, partial [Clostridiales bacterium 38_11]